MQPPKAESASKFDREGERTNRRKRRLPGSLAAVRNLHLVVLVAKHTLKLGRRRSEPPWVTEPPAAAGGKQRPAPGRQPRSVGFYFHGKERARIAAIWKHRGQGDRRDGFAVKFGTVRWSGR